MFLVADGNDDTLTEEKKDIKIMFPSGYLIFKTIVKYEINSKLKVSTMCREDTNILTAKAFFSMIILAMSSVFLFKLLPKAYQFLKIVNHIKHAHKNTNLMF